MRISILAFAAMIAMLCTGCQTTNSSKIGAPATAITKTIIATPSVEKGQAVEASASSTNILIFTFGPSKFADGATLPASSGLDPFAALKAAAVYNACEASGADMILAPSYVLKVDDFIIFKKATCTVKGFAGKITGISKLDTKLIENIQTQENEKSSLLPF